MKDICKITCDTLEKYEIPYDEIYFGKPYADFYIDDLAVNSYDDLEKKVGFYKTFIKERDFNEIIEDKMDIIIKKSNNDKINYRLRYRFGLKNKITKINTLQFSNEFFLAIGNKNSTFEKNRFLIGITTAVSKKYEVQFNYLNQIDNRINDENGSNFFQFVNIFTL
jgi:hypothetical protein